VSEHELKEAVVAYRVDEYQSPYAPLIEQLYHEEVLDARSMSPEDKFFLGEELFDYACEITMAGIRNQNPNFSEADCERELERRLDFAARMEGMERCR
jgi:hypothetical protein